MESIKRDFKRIYYNKAYLLLLALTAACSYGFKIVHPVMGIDDTPYAYYFEEGLAAVVGRWVLFVLNKVLSLSDFAPFLTDFAAVLILMMAVTLWGLLFYSVLGERIPRYGYWFFSCIFLSCPLIAEVFTYFLHNGIAIGYLCCGISLYALGEAYSELEKKRMRGFAGRIALAVLFMTVAMGCYESFMIVWLAGVVLLLLSERIVGGSKGVFLKLGTAAATAACGMVLRSIVLHLVIAAFDLSYLQDAAVQRSVGEMLGWIFEPGAAAEFAMILKRLFVMYGVFGYAYYPIKIFVLASAVMVLYSLWRTVRQKDLWILILQAGSFIAAFLLAVVEGKATLYRSAQFLPLFCGFGILMGACALQGFVGKVRTGQGKRKLRRFLAGSATGLYLLCGAVILWNQCTDLNHWFYVDYRKYEYSREYMSRVANELEKNFDTSKPIVFTGEWENPKGLVKDAYVSLKSDTFYKMKAITDLVDDQLLEKFYRDYGVWVAQTPSLSVISWGKYAFDTDAELVRFMNFHGHKFRPLSDSSLYEEAELYARDLPSFPREGSIVDRGSYIIVHF